MYVRVMEGTSRYVRVLQGTSRYVRVVQGTTHQGTLGYFRVLQRTSEASTNQDAQQRSTSVDRSERFIYVPGVTAPLP